MINDYTKYLTVFWICCGIISYGLFYGSFQKSFPRIARDDNLKDRKQAIIAAIFGPIGIIATLVALDIYYICFKKPSDNKINEWIKEREV